MKKYISILMKTRLFAGLREEEVLGMLGCLQASMRTYRKDETVFRRGDHPEQIALLLDGCLHIQRDDYWGSRSIVSAVRPGELFGEAYAAPGSGPMVNDVVAVEDSTVAFFQIQKLLTVCSSACRFHSLVVQNLFFAISEKNRTLMQKLGHMSRRSTREKLISYLSEEAGRHGSGTFTIPFNRQQLADFLSVDRSAMSSELGKLRDEGLLTFHKNEFSLHAHQNAADFT